MTLLRPAQVGCQLQQGSPSIAADPAGPRLAEGVCGGKLIFGRGAGAGRLLVFDTEDGHVQSQLRVGSGPPVVAYSPDGSLLAVASAGGQVHLYDGASGAPRGVLERRRRGWRQLQRVAGHRQPARRVALATALAFSSDGSHLAVAAQQGRVMAWSLRSHTAIPLGKTIAPGAAVAIYAAAFTTDGTINRRRFLQRRAGLQHSERHVAAHPARDQTGGRSGAEPQTVANWPWRRWGRASEAKV